ncbi:hypothetical protein THRCLA_22050 [Thraustotheca clavata]|uniref:Transmembrane protein n=1 Tax=Thraustotheca clavata TaxID=74557 RepID=A0A1V9ZDJ2_9STRA|nr:hypothetical protein THRCLA_22050 [Thraustotheca clavata]
MALNVDCEAKYSSILNFTSWYISDFQNLAPLALETMQDIQQLNISIIQFLVADNNTANVMWYQRGILDLNFEQSWIYFGWCFMYEWAIGEREVLSFDGDIQTLTLLSSRSNSVSVTLNKNEIPTTVSMFYGGFTLYVTIFLIGATVVVAIYAVFVCGGDVEPWNLLEVNRLLGHVWVGRTVLIIRSVTALWVLNSSRLEVALMGNGVQFQSPGLAWTSVILASSELLWLVYMANNILSPITQQYTPFYVVKSTVLAWFITAVFSLCAPQTYHASIHRTCDYYDMDFALTCSSALVEIGSWSRAQWNIYFVLASVAVTAISEMYFRPRSIPRPIPTLLLTSTSYFLLDFTDWYAHGHNIYLDRASVFLSGMISVKWKDFMYVFDVKRWCLYSYKIDPADHDEEPRIAKAVPMWRVG